MKATWLRGGQIVDGTMAPAWKGDLLIAGGRIAALGAGLSEARVAEHLAALGAEGVTATEIDCAGKVIAPGFIDVHTHDDATVLDMPQNLPKLSQGITTVIVGNCGISLAPVITQAPISPLSLLGDQQFRFGSFGDYADAVDAGHPCVNVAALLGHTALRIKHMEDLGRTATVAERDAMLADVREAMLAGALGLSSGVFYEPAFAADIDELVPLATEVARHGGVYATHIRSELETLLPSMMEAADTARSAGVPVIFSHHKCCGPSNWGRARETLALIEKLAEEQGAGLDVYPYTAGSTVLRPDLADGVIDILITNSESHPEMMGRYLKDIAAEWNVDQQTAAERLKPGNACYFQMCDEDVDRVVAHPQSMIGSDGLPHDVRPHPRLWGAFPRVLASYWREKNLMSMEQAVHKMTGLSARRFRIPERGELREGFHADVVVFDPTRVRDRASFEDPIQFSEGIEQVYVNGELSYTEAGRGTDARAGRFVRRG
ncbi:D-aminoacylase [Diaphorobacter ruginosibacter]|uniref:D-aminoacylase n=1 Tax=Diaphorobacter ruginosibacter TaxID=1715720 RepID=A0A7G9RM43_9BURK|nr:D-aminoacylase [Diaphorobacter ruginosibacter]QNN56668.1 D-aminoacylase [Diaphorobacter ruginosibacter]